MLETSRSRSALSVPLAGVRPGVDDTVGDVQVDIGQRAGRHLSVLADIMVDTIGIGDPLAVRPNRAGP